MERRVKKVGLREAGTDAAYWRTRPPVERLAAVEELRREYHRWRYDAEPRLSRVHRVAPR